MNILITIGMVIVFISAFFIFLTGDVLIKNSFDCTSEEGRSVCVYKGLPGVAVFGILIISLFIVIDIMTVYLIVTNVS